MLRELITDLLSESMNIFFNIFLYLVKTQSELIASTCFDVIREIQSNFRWLPKCLKNFLFKIIYLSQQYVSFSLIQ